MTQFAFLAVCVAVCVAAAFGLAFWAFRTGKQTTRAKITADEAAQLLAIASEKAEIQREFEEHAARSGSTASERLRVSKWNRDRGPLPR